MDAHRQSARRGGTRPVDGDGLHRYTEAIQNEIGAGSKGLTEVWTESSQLITSGIKKVVVDPDPPGGIVQGFRVEYHVAPTTVLGPDLKLPFTLGHRPTVAIDIWQMTNGARIPGGCVRIITEGYSSGEGYSAPTTSPHGKFVGSAAPQGSGKLLGTAAYWDGKWDHGDDDGENAPVRDDFPPNGDYYAAYLVLDGQALEGTGNFYKFRKTV